MWPVQATAGGFYTAGHRQIRRRRQPDGGASGFETVSRHSTRVASRRERLRRALRFLLPEHRRGGNWRGADRFSSERLVNRTRSFDSIGNTYGFAGPSPKSQQKRAFALWHDNCVASAIAWNESAGAANPRSLFDTNGNTNNFAGKT